MSKSQAVLTLNGGSSSIKFAIFASDAKSLAAGTKLVSGTVERIGLSGTTLTMQVGSEEPEAAIPVETGGHDDQSHRPVNHRVAAKFLLDQLDRRSCLAGVTAIGHRVVHGMTHSEPEKITPALIEELRKIMPFDPDHLPNEIVLIEEFARSHPNLPQVACFDTAFHRTMPRVAKMLPIPRKYDAKGVQRYGFHGLSYAFLAEELARLKDPAILKGRVIMAHLGNGASMAALLDGKSIDTTMGFTPASGLVMSTRTGDIDPGLPLYFSQNEGIGPKHFQGMVNHDSGLMGVSETSSDMHDLLGCEATDVRCAEAVSLFCYQAKKWIGALAAALGGLDTLVFAGGIGENAPAVRQRICEGLGFLGIQLDSGRNDGSKPIISSARSKAKVRLIHTNEELMIARSVAEVLRLSS